MIALIWLVVLLGLALWSLLGWGLYRLLTLDQAWLGDLGAVIQSMPLGHWLETWVPGWRPLVELAVDALQGLLSALGGAAPVLVWALWGSGTMAMVVVGAGLSVLVARWQDRHPAAGSA